MDAIQMAINRLECGNTAHSCEADYIRLAIQALKKQVPYKREKWESGHSCCGVCKRGIIREDKYCCYCGQKIDWNE